MTGVPKEGVAAGTDGRLVVGWGAQDNPSERSIHLTRSTTAGASWGPVTRFVVPLPPAGGNKWVSFDAIAAGPSGRYAVVGSNVEFPYDPVYLRGRF